MNCKKCGAMLNQTDEFCYNCGEKVTNNVGLYQNNTPMTNNFQEPNSNNYNNFYNNQPNNINNQYMPNNQMNNKQKNNKNIIIVLVLILLIIIASIGGFYIYSSLSKNTTNNNNTEQKDNNSNNTINNDSSNNNNNSDTNNKNKNTNSNTKTLTNKGLSLTYSTDKWSLNSYPETNTESLITKNSAEYFSISYLDYFTYSFEEYVNEQKHIISELDYTISKYENKTINNSTWKLIEYNSQDAQYLELYHLDENTSTLYTIKCMGLTSYYNEKEIQELYETIEIK